MPLDAPDAGSAPAADQQPDLRAVLARLNQIAGAANALTGADPAAIDRLWRLVAESAVALIPGVSAALFGYDPARQLFAGLPHAAAGGLAPALAAGGPLLANLGQAAARRGQPVLSCDEPGWAVPAALQSAGVRVVGAFPFVSTGEVLGVLYAGRAEGRAFTPVESALLENLAGQAAAAAYRLAAVEAEQRILGGTFGAMGEFAANLLHHINNRIGTIPVRVEGIQDKCGDLVAANAYLAVNLAQIGESASEALSALRESLAILKPGSGGLVSPDLCVNQAVAAAQLPADVTLHIADLRSLPPVYAGPESLALVIVTVLQDAAAAPAAGGAIAIAGVAGGGYVELTIHSPAPAHQDARKDPPPSLSAAPAAGGPLEAADGPDPTLWWLKLSLARLGGSLVVQDGEAGGRVYRLRLRAVGGGQDGR